MRGGNGSGQWNVHIYVSGHVDGSKEGGRRWHMDN